MSYVRFGSHCCDEPCKGSDVYVYSNMDGYYECQNIGHSFCTRDAGEMIAHLLEHRSKDHHIGDRVIDMLRAEH